jgi:hypothetical protein
VGVNLDASPAQLDFASLDERRGQSIQAANSTQDRCDFIGLGNGGEQPKHLAIESTLEPVKVAFQDRTGNDPTDHDRLAVSDLAKERLAHHARKNGQVGSGVDQEIGHREPLVPG